MEYLIDYKELLEKYNEEDYVYIIEGCYDLYASLNPPSDEPCERCGSYEWAIDKGIVADLRKKNKPKQHKKINYKNNRGE